MQQPNPWIMFMGGIALLNVAGLMWGLHAPVWVRYAAMAVCVALGLLAMGIGLRKGFEKKAERPKFVSRHRRSGTPTVREGTARKASAPERTGPARRPPPP